MSKGPIENDENDYGDKSGKVAVTAITIWFSSCSTTCGGGSLCERISAIEPKVKRKPTVFNAARLNYGRLTGDDFDYSTISSSRLFTTVFVVRARPNGRADVSNPNRRVVRGLHAGGHRDRIIRTVRFTAATTETVPVP